MKKFIFRLEPLYEYRQRLEELRQLEFGEALRKLEEENSRFEALKDSYRKFSKEVDDMKEKGADVMELNLHLDYLPRLKHHIGEQEKILVHASAFFEIKRGELTEASKQRKIMEMMKEKSLGSYMDDLNRDEQKISDDMVNSRFKRREGK